MLLPPLRIARLAITNFRTFRTRTEIVLSGASGQADSMLTLHGGNGTGKSTALRALALFFPTAIKWLQLRSVDVKFELKGELLESGRARQGMGSLSVQDWPVGVTDPLEIEIHFEGHGVGALRLTATRAGTGLLWALTRAHAVSGSTFVPVLKGECAELLTALETPLGPGTRAFALLDARRRGSWMNEDASAEGSSAAASEQTMAPALLERLHSFRTSRSPDERDRWRAFVEMLSSFPTLAGKEISVERASAGGPPQLIFEEPKRLVLELQELSSGEQQVIVLCATLLASRAAIVAIEEPEISLSATSLAHLLAILKQQVASGRFGQLLMESHVAALDGPDVIRFSRDEGGSTRVERGPSASEAAVRLAAEALQAGAKQQWVSSEGFTKLPSKMVEELLHPAQGGHVWFLKGSRHWEAWPEAEVADLLTTDAEPEEAGGDDPVVG